MTPLMYKSSIYLHFVATPSNKHILRMFFEDWADRIGANKIKYSIVAGAGLDGMTTWSDIIRVDFENEEDATIMRLKGIPDEFQKYLKFVDWFTSIDDDCLVQVN